jgi:hypothetical protein
MKKILFLCIALAAAATGFSQARFGIKGGVNLANQKVSVEVMGFGVSQDGDGIVGFHLGGVAEFPMGRHFAFRPELLFTGKGANMNVSFDDEEEETSKAKIRPYYLELPLNLVYGYNLASGTRLFLGGGPSLAYRSFW